MLDATDLMMNPTFRATDPAQATFRGMLAAFSDAELERVEEELGTFSLTGLIPSALQSLLDAGTGMPAAA